MEQKVPPSLAKMAANMDAEYEKNADDVARRDPPRLSTDQKGNVLRGPDGKVLVVLRDDPLPDPIVADAKYQQLHVPAQGKMRERMQERLKQLRADLHSDDKAVAFAAQAEIDRLFKRLHGDKSVAQVQAEHARDLKVAARETKAEVQRRRAKRKAERQARKRARR